MYEVLILLSNYLKFLSPSWDRDCTPKVILYYVGMS